MTRDAGAGASEHDVLVAGDGPAGAAVAAACRRQGLDVVVVGPSASWSNTYGAWRDELPDLPDPCFAKVSERAVVRGRTERELARPYGVLDNAAVRAQFGLDEVRRHGRVERIVDAGDLVVAHLEDGDLLAGRWLVDATGRTQGEIWQTAYGVVAPSSDVERAGLRTDATTLMHWLPGAVTPSFVYAVPVGTGRDDAGRGDDGWLVEVTSLAARPAVDPVRLRSVLIDLLGEAPVVAAEALGRLEAVRIPMGGVPLPEPGRRVVPFGTAGGLGHPLTGYSLGASFAAADRLAGAIAGGNDPVDAVWTRPLRRSRQLHDGALDVLLGLDGDGLADFFDAFFAIPLDLWSDFLRVDVDDRRVATAMVAVFRRAPWSVRRRLLGLDPLLVARIARLLVRPG